MEKMKLSDNMVVVLKALVAHEGSAFAKELVIEGKTFNSVNATLAAMAGEKYGLVSKKKEVCGEKFLTKYTLTEAGQVVFNELDTPVETATDGE